MKIYEILYKYGGRTAPAAFQITSYRFLMWAWSMSSILMKVRAYIGELDGDVATDPIPVRSQPNLYYMIGFFQDL